MTSLPAQPGGAVNSVASVPAQQPSDKAHGDDSTDQKSVPRGGKEIEPSVVGNQAKPESFEAEEIKELGEVPIEVEGWMERVERGEDVHLAQPVTHQGKTLVKSAKPQDTQVVLPLTEEEVEKGLHVKVFRSLRWLAVWCVRLVKKLPEKVIYKN